jgi:DNA-binding transcriptional ArsR family regulator
MIEGGRLREESLDSCLSIDNYREMSLESRGGPDEPGTELQKVSDVRTMRALAHPVRIALIEALVLGGAMTATEAGERIGESPTTCSFHLRQLAKYGLVEEAGGGRGRARPWRLTGIGLGLAAPEDAETELAAGVLLRLVRERQLERYWTWLQSMASYPRSWREAADDSEYILFLTVGELKQLKENLSAMLMPLFLERMADPSKRPAGSVPVELLLFSYPIALPPAGDAEAGDEDEGTLA